MINRRQFLIGTSAIAIAQLLGGCNNDPNKLKVLLLEGSIPSQLLGRFRKKIDLEKNLKFKPETNLKKIFELLQIWQGKVTNEEEKSIFSWPLGNKKKINKADIVTLGDYWLNLAISQELIEPLSLENIPNWTNLPQQWQQLVKRNNQGVLDENGLIWGAPYRWGSVMIAYREDKFKKLGWTPEDWKDLWNPEIKGKLSLLQQPREIIGLTLKKLGYSYNSPDLYQIANLKSELTKLHKNVKFYDSKNYLQPLILGDTSIAVGWSNDILPVVKNYPNIKVIIPKSGTSLWADIWVKPKTDNAILPDVINQWIDYCWQPQAASEICLYSDASSPIIFSMKTEEIPKDIRNNPLLFPDANTLKNSEFLLPLSQETKEQYEDLISSLNS